eukprot:UN13133
MAWRHLKTKLSMEQIYKLQAWLNVCREREKKGDTETYGFYKIIRNFIFTPRSSVGLYGEKMEQVQKLNVVEADYQNMIKSGGDVNNSYKIQSILRKKKDLNFKIIDLEKAISGKQKQVKRRLKSYYR